MKRLFDPGYFPLLSMGFKFIQPLEPAGSSVLCKNWMCWKWGPNYSICELVITSFKLCNGYSTENPSAHWVISRVNASAAQSAVVCLSQAVLAFSVGIFTSQFLSGKVTFQLSLSKYEVFKKSKQNWKKAVSPVCSRVEFCVLSLEKAFHLNEMK